MRATGFVLILALVSTACSTRPREFKAQLGSPAADQSAFDVDLLRCQVMVRRGAARQQD
jgi:starvation-inducible outer membrane lipoprotein